jgi:hypothetical protein
MNTTEWILQSCTRLCYFVVTSLLNTLHYLKSQNMIFHQRLWNLFAVPTSITISMKSHYIYPGRKKKIIVHAERNICLRWNIRSAPPFTPKWNTEWVTICTLIGDWFFFFLLLHKVSRRGPRLLKTFGKRLEVTAEQYFRTKPSWIERK